MGCFHASAMWEDSNVNLTQQRSIQQHLDAFFGKRFIVPDQQVNAIGKNALEAIMRTFLGKNKERVAF